MTKDKLLKILKANFKQLSFEFGVRRIGLFGSYAKGTNKKDSDVDLLVEFERPIGLRFMEFSERIENLIGSRVDILTPAGINSIRNHLISTDIKGSLTYV
jgi:predicted nucleotidyltransferase